MPDTLLPKVLVDKAREVIEANRKAARRIAVAESCTGGLVSAALTEIPGSSEMFEAGYVTYSNAAKICELKVSEDVVDTFGAVSVATAWAMARGALAASDADVAVAITGIAGPGGGSAEKPVGTVCFCVRLAEGPTLTRTLLLPGDRSDVRERSTTVAMHLLRSILTASGDAD